MRNEVMRLREGVLFHAHTARTHSSSLDAMSFVVTGFMEPVRRGVMH
jgi:hypothetical protein